MIGTLKEIILKRKLILELAKSDFRKQFAGSYFGLAWMFIQPLVTVLIYILIFGLGFRSPSPIDGVPYALWLIPGIVPWFFFSDAMNNGTRCLQEYSYLVKKVVFQVEILPVVKLVSNMIVHGIFVIIMFIAFICYGVFPTLYWIQLIYYSLATFLFSLGLVYFTSAVNVFFKDMSQLVGILLQFGMWMVPIMWNESMFSGKSIYPLIVNVVKFNPVFYLVNGYRDSMVMGNWFFERPVQTLYFWGVVLVTFFIGNKMFKRMRPHFSDVL